MKRIYFVFSRETTSRCLSLSCGVLQGSSLSPTLFNIYMKPRADLILPYGIKIVTYADDTQLVVALNHPLSSPSDLESCLKKVATWMERSCLRLNGDKTELMLLGNATNKDLKHEMKCGIYKADTATPRGASWCYQITNFRHKELESR